MYNVLGLLCVSVHMRYLEGDCTMTNKEKLFQYILSLTNEEAEAFIAYLETASSSEEGAPPVPPCSSPQDQAVAV